MSQEERIEKIRELVQEKELVDEDGVVSFRGYPVAGTAMTTYKISIDSILEGTGWVHNQNRTAVLTNRLNNLSEQQGLKTLVRDNLSQAMHLNEALATVFYDKKGKVKPSIIEAFTACTADAKHIKNILSVLVSNKTPLNDLSGEKLDSFVNDAAIPHSIPAATTTHISIALKNILVSAIAQTGIYAPFALRYADGRHVSDFIEAERRRIKEPMTVYEHCIKIFPDPKTVYAKANVIIALKESADIEPALYGLALTSEYANCFNSKMVKTSVVTAIAKLLTELQIQGIKFATPVDASKKQQRPFLLDLSYLDYLKTKDTVKQQDRTFGWYVFETIDYNTLDGIQKTRLHSSYKDHFNTKLPSMTKEDFALIRGNYQGRTYRLSDIIHKIHEEGMYDKSVMSEDVEIENNTLDDNDPVWVLWNGIKIDFNGVDEIYEEAFRAYVRKLNRDKMTVEQNRLYDMLEYFRASEMPSLSELTRNDEARFHIALKRSFDTAISETPKNKARRALSTFRTMISHLKKLDLDLVPKGYKCDYIFRLPKWKKPEIKVYTDDEQEAIVKFLSSPASLTDKVIPRLYLLAIGIQLLSFRRAAEIASEKEGCGLKLSAFTPWGHTGEMQFNYFRSKAPMKRASVLIADLICYRTDPFAKAIRDGLLLALYGEALAITSEYRHRIPVTLQDYLFVEKTTLERGLFQKIIQAQISKSLTKLLKHLGIPPEKTGHTARHSAATAIILTGGTAADAAHALGDKVITVERSYHQFTSRQDTLKLTAEKGRTSLVDSLKDAETFKHLEEGEYNVCTPEELSPDGHKMGGGQCNHTAEGRLACPSYQMMRGSKSCPGCDKFQCSIIDNKEYWENELKATLINMENSQKDSMAYDYEAMHHRVAVKMLERIEEKEHDVEYGFDDE